MLKFSTISKRKAELGLPRREQLGNKALTCFFRRLCDSSLQTPQCPRRLGDGSSSIRK